MERINNQYNFHNSFNKFQNNQTEILAPAGSLETMKAAINAGADAIYMGSTKYGARAYATNFDHDEVLEALDYAHLFGRKIYLTVNTLCNENEIFDLYDFLKDFYDNGLDAVIVQDMGVLNFVNKNFPSLPIHLSTQTTITTGTFAPLFKDKNVTRVVPARELSIEEIERLARESGLEVEVFIHGALCYAYSGQCLLSFLRGGRSGNRGRCAGSCRLPYEFESGNKEIGPYILSMKENCALEVFGNLIKAGAMSFKIEGRMKKPEYVAFITSVYRKYANFYEKYGYEKYNSFIEGEKDMLKKDILKMAEIYNRNGFTNAYLVNPSFENRRAPVNILSDKRPNHGGVLVGMVTEVDRKRNVCKFKAVNKIGAHDVLDFRNDKEEVLYEYTTKDNVNKGKIVEARFLKGSKINKGNLVYRTRNAALIEDIRKKYIEKNITLEVDFSFFGQEGEKAILRVSCGELSNEKSYFDYQVESDEKLEKASKKPVSEDRVKEILTQLGETRFSAASIDVFLSGDLFIPVSVLKKMRREALEGLTEEILKSARREESDFEHSSESKFESEGSPRIDFSESEFDCENSPKTAHFDKNFGNSNTFRKASVLNKNQLELCLKEDRLDLIFLRMENFSVEELSKNIDEITSCGKKAGLFLPHIVRYDTLGKLENNYKEIFVEKVSLISEIIVRNFEEVNLLLNEFKVNPQIITLDTGMYTENSSACEFFSELGIESYTKSFETDLNKFELIRKDCRVNYTAVVYAKPAAMTAAGCVQKNIGGCVNRGDGKTSSSLRVNTLKTTDGQDKFGHELYALNYCRFCYNEIYTDKGISDFQSVDRLIELGVRSFRVDFTLEDDNQVCEVLNRLCKI